MSIILPHTDLDIPFFRSNGQCYQRTQQGVALTPTHTWETMAFPDDFGIHSSCQACYDAVLTPEVCPCSAETWYNIATTPCGDPDDLCHRRYTWGSTVFVEGSCGNVRRTALDTPILTWVIAYGGEGGTPCLWSTTDRFRYNGTNVSLGSDDGGEILTLSSLGWKFRLTSNGYNCWTGYKKYGNSPGGVYERSSGCFILPTALTLGVMS